MSGPIEPTDLVPVANSHTPKQVFESVTDEKATHVHSARAFSDDGREYPNEEEKLTLRRVSDKIPWLAFTIAIVEFCERFSYYGTIAVFVNYIQQPLPKGSTTGAGHKGQSGALGMGQMASTGFTLFNTFWCYLTPIAGAWIADEFWGRLKTIQTALYVCLLGHIILIIAALPPVIVHPHSAMGCFAVGLVIFGIGVGGFKSNVTPLIAEQYKGNKLYIKTLPKTGERVIVDPSFTVSRIFLYFYFMVNFGALVGSIANVYAEKYVGFWLAYLLPTIMFSFCPLVVLACRHKYEVTPPTGSVLGKALKLLALAMKGRWSWNPVKFIRNCRAPDFWENVKPSRIHDKPAWMTFDDKWVDEMSRALKACGVFMWYPLYWLSYAQISNNLTSQAATMELHGIPNDILNNLDPLALIISIPIMDYVVYPGIRRMGVNFTPLKRIWLGFMLATLGMVAAALVQHYIYKMSPCGNHASARECEQTPAPINVWAQTPSYVLVAWSEIFASVTGYEYAYMKAPKNMKSLVYSIYLFQNAISSALGQALIPLSRDPYLIWLYGLIAVISFVGGNLFYLSHLKLDRQEDKLNSLEASSYLGRKPNDQGEVQKTDAEN